MRERTNEIDSFCFANAFEKIIEWVKPSNIHGKIGIKILRFVDVVTDIVAESTICNVQSSLPYKLVINGKLLSNALVSGVWT